MGFYAVDCTSARAPRSLFLRRFICLYGACFSFPATTRTQLNTELDKLVAADVETIVEVIDVSGHARGGGKHVFNSALCAEGYLSRGLHLAVYFSRCAIFTWEMCAQKHRSGDTRTAVSIESERGTENFRSFFPSLVSRKVQGAR